MQVVKAAMSAAGPVLDLSFLIDHVMMDIKPLHWHKVIGSDIPLKVCSLLDRHASALLLAHGAGMAAAEL